MKKKKATLEGLNALLPHFSRTQGWEEQLDLHTVFVNWEELVDEDTAVHCQPLKIVKKVLWVEVENSAWLQQLQFQTVQLLAILNDSLQRSKLIGLRFCIAEQRQNSKNEKDVVLRYVPPPAEELEAFEKQAATIVDKDAREALVRFWYLSKACRKE